MFQDIHFCVNYYMNIIIFILPDHRHFNEIEHSGGWKESFPKYLIDNINVKNAAELYIFSENTYIESLKKETAAFIQE